MSVFNDIYLSLCQRDAEKMTDRDFENCLNSVLDSMRCNGKIDGFIFEIKADHARIHYHKSAFGSLNAITINKKGLTKENGLVFGVHSS